MTQSKPTLNSEQVHLLKEGLAHLSAHQGALDRFEAFHALLVAGNRRMNLISRGDEDRVVTHHYLESAGLVRVLHFPQNARVLDLGSGAGFPGFPLKFVRPDLEMILVESRQKRAAFLQSVVEEMALSGVEVWPRRVEDLTLPPVDMVVTRAVAKSVQLLKWTRGLLKPGGVLAALKGLDIEEEIQNLKKSPALRGVEKWETEIFDPFPDMTRFRKSTLLKIYKK